MSEKPHKGTIWDPEVMRNLPGHRGFIAVGRYHRKEDDVWTVRFTSEIVKIERTATDTLEIETRNSRYTLVLT